MNTKDRFQDWTPIVLHKQISSTDAARSGHVISIPKYSTNSINKFIDDNEIHPINISTKEIGLVIQNGRKQKNLSQKDLDKLCNFPPNTCQLYENGKAVIVTEQLNKIAKHLGIKIPRHKKI